MFCYNRNLIYNDYKLGGEKMTKEEKFKINANVSYPYLFAPEGFWFDNNNNSYDLYTSEGDKKYMDKQSLENCINTLLKDEKALKSFNTYKHIYDLEELRSNKLKELETALQYK